MSDIDMSRRNTVPRPLTDKEKQKLDEFVDMIHYSARYDSKHSFKTSSHLQTRLYRKQGHREHFGPQRKEYVRMRADLLLPIQ